MIKLKSLIPEIQIQPRNNKSRIGYVFCYTEHFGNDPNSKYEIIGEDKDLWFVKNLQTKVKFYTKKSKINNETTRPVTKWDKHLK